MKVYHGSHIKITQVDLSMSGDRRDFGKGFYVTNIREQAETWAANIGEKHGTEGVVTEFEFFESAFTDWHYRVLRFDGYTEEWLDFVVMNRNPQNPVPTHGYDIVEGPVADDQIQRRLRLYLQGKISKEQFLHELTFRKPSHQICFGSTRALLMLEPADDYFDITFHIENIAEPLVAALMLDRDIDEAKAADLFFASDTFVQLADEKTKLYLKPWQDIYEVLKQEMR
jgi:hypothetical protein